MDNEAFIYACSIGDLATVKNLIYAVQNNIADINGESGFKLACDNCHMDVAQFLFDFGVNVDQQNTAGVTALMHAVFFNNTEQIEFLLKNGVNVNLEDEDGETALIVAVRECRIETIELLKYANLNHQCHS